MLYPCFIYGVYTGEPRLWNGHDIGLARQVTGDTAKQLSERFGKIMQDRESYSIISGDISISRSKQMEAAIPSSKISGLSSGEFVGMVAT